MVSNFNDFPLCDLLHPINSPIEIYLRSVNIYSVTSNNQIYRNTFSNTNYSLMAAGSNASSTGAAGLFFKCNTFNNTTTDDIFVAEDDAMVGSVKTNQGSFLSLQQPAGNRFINTC